MEQGNNKINVQEYAKQYSEETFWKKILDYAKNAGSEVVYKALILYYSLQSNTTIKERTLIIGALGYFIFAVDLIPDLTPIVGYTDDFSIILAAINLLTNIDDEVIKQSQEKLHTVFKAEGINSLFNKTIRLLVVGHKGAGKTTFLDSIRKEENEKFGPTSISGRNLATKKIVHNEHTIIFQEMKDIAGENSCKHIINEGKNANVVIYLFNVTKFLNEKTIVWECAAQLKAISKFCEPKQVLAIATHTNEQHEEVKSLSREERDNFLRKKIRDTFKENECEISAEFIKDIQFISVDLKDKDETSRIIPMLCNI